MTIDTSKYMTAVKLHSMLEEVIAKNPDALVLADMDNGSGHAVLSGISAELDSDGDARFSLRDYQSGKKIEIVEFEELPYRAQDF